MRQHDRDRAYMLPLEKIAPVPLAGEIIEVRGFRTDVSDSIRRIRLRTQWAVRCEQSGGNGHS